MYIVYQKYYQITIKKDDFLLRSQNHLFLNLDNIKSKKIANKAKIKRKMRMINICLTCSSLGNVYRYIKKLLIIKYSILYIFVI